MIDFLRIATRTGKHGVIEVYPNFIITKSKDLMIRGSDFYAIWLEERGLWSTEEQDALQLIDRELDIYANEHKQFLGDNVRVLHMWDAQSGMIDIRSCLCCLRATVAWLMSWCGTALLLLHRRAPGTATTQRRSLAEKLLSFSLSGCRIILRSL